MAYGESETADQRLRERVEHLTSEVARLERELGDVHSADYNTLRRAYVSLVQHFRALQVEAQMLKAHINALDVEVMNPDEVANELTALAAVAAVAVAAGRMLRHPRLAPLRVAVWGAGALFLSWRFTSASFQRLGSLLVRNRQRKRRLQQDWETLTERIRIMDELTRWEGQDPALQPPGQSIRRPSSEEGSASWVSVSRAEEGEGRVSYPRPYSPANATAAGAADEDEGKVAYPQVHASKDAEQEGEVAYPSPAKPPLPGASGRRGGNGGQLRAPDLPSAPPLPSKSAQAEARQRDLEPALHA